MSATAPSRLSRVRISPGRFLKGKTKVLAAVAVLLVAFYLLAVTPVRTYFQQQSQMRQAEQRYAVLSSTNKELQERATQLQGDAEIKRLAREKYELVEPGQTAFAVMPPSLAMTNQATQDAHIDVNTNTKHGWPERIWNAVNPWN